MITVGNRTENVIFEEVEHILLPNEWNSCTLQVAALLVSLLIISLNGTIVNIILKQERKTFLDWMIVIDSHLCIGATLMHSWNTLETLLKHSWNTLEVLLRLFKHLPYFGWSDTPKWKLYCGRTDRVLLSLLKLNIAAEYWEKLRMTSRTKTKQPHYDGLRHYHN